MDEVWNEITNEIWNIDRAPKTTWQDYSLEEINQLPVQKVEVLTLYYQAQEELANDPIGRQVIKAKSGSSIREIYTTIQKWKLEKSAHYLFPSNHVINFYPAIKENRCAKETTCAFSNARIRKGELYCCYRPLLYDLTSEKRYVLKRTLKVELAYIDFLPNTIGEFDIFSEKVEHYWNYPTDTLDYERINHNVKGSLTLQQLKSR